MGIGQIISDTFGVVRERFGPLLGLWAIYFGITIALFIVLAISIGAAGLAGLSTMAEGNALAAGAGMVVAIVFFYLVYILVVMAQYASMITMASPIGRPSFSEALSAGWRAAPALLLLMVVLIVGYLVVGMVLGLVGAAFAALGDLGSSLYALALVIVVVWLACRMTPLFAIVAVDRVRNPFSAVARSWSLTRGHALTIFLASLVFVVLLVLVCGVAFLPSIGLLSNMGNPAALAEGGPAMGGILLLFLGIMVASILFTLLYCAFMAVVHAKLTNAAGEGVVEAFA